MKTSIKLILLTAALGLSAAATGARSPAAASPPPTARAGALDDDLIFAGTFEPVVAGTIDLDSLTPRDGAVLSAGQHYSVGARYTLPAGTGAGAVTLRLDGMNITPESHVTESAIARDSVKPLTAGEHRAELTVGSARVSWTFRAVEGPRIAVFTPSNVSLAAGSPTVITAHFDDAGSPIDPDSIRLSLDDAEVTSQVAVQMTTPGQGTLQYTTGTPLPAGQHTADLSIANRAGAVRRATTVFRVEDAPSYSLEFAQPAPGSTVLEPKVPVRLLAGSNRSDAVSVTLNDQPTAVGSFLEQPRPFDGEVMLQPGENTLTAVAMFADGQSRTTTTTLTYDAPPVVTFTSPQDWAALGPVAATGGVTPGGSTDLTGAVQRPVTITGTLNKPVTGVTINQQQAQLSADGRSFTFERYFLHEGTNLLSANATDSHGRTGTAQITVYVDQTAPLLTVEGPLPGAVTSAVRIDVRGVVNDAVEAGLNAPEPAVKVSANGHTVTATVADRYYLARNVPLEVGSNTVSVTATDVHGNARSQAVTVTRIAAGSRRLTLLSGDRQTGPVKQSLSAPLRIVAIDADGLPLADVPVHFDVLRGAGTIRTVESQPDTPDGVNAARNIAVRTDASGQAKVWLTLGTEAAESGNMVRAWSEDLAEDVVFTATGLRGTPAWVLVSGLSGSQYVSTHSQPVEPLSAVVIDADRNPMTGTPVQFTIEDGDAHFTAQSAAGGSVSADGRQITVTADKNGMASVRPITGAIAGNVHVRAQAIVAGAPFGAADFQLLVLERKDGPTAFSGVVLDHTGAPLPGVRLSISRTSLSTVSNAEGRFRFDDQVPPGKIDLFVDGTAIRQTRRGQTVQYPGLHFETAVIQGQVNQLPHPIYLPPINLGQAQIVGGDSDVTLTIPGLDGFAMRVKAHSVTFPDGSTTGPLVVTPVNGDRLPMVPPGGFGTFGAIAWTIQPTGTRFDPPVEVSMPNLAGMKPGETLPIVQWDHDLATFVPMGRGTVSEDGTRVVSDPGSGITKAGWGGGPPPTPPNCGTNPPAESCRGGQCGPCGPCKQQSQAQGQQCPSCTVNIAKVGKECTTSNYCRRCKGNGSCGPDPARFPETVTGVVTDITFKDANVVIGATPNKAEFSGYEFGNPAPAHPADWEFDIEPYCTPEGKWKFKLTKAEVTGTIIRPATAPYVELTDAMINGHTASTPAGYCTHYNHDEYELRRSASSHYPGGPAGNPDVAAMNAAGMNVGADGKVYDRWEEVLAHENQHYSRFKHYMRHGWADFKRKIDALEAHMYHFPTKEQAKNAQHIKVLFKNAQIELQNDTVARRNAIGGSGDHTPENAFYGCSLGAMAGAFTLLDYLRVTHGCPAVSRPAASCPN
ncbi:carboxypeptidase-like regulatory domain-containing protein [Tahibacter amnicola]|uniref:Carboxypeptidase-like regulatory domain-containing protein n=1 Tax=Tahibacter amnicola TaxID=2976241 RepID=A0ABY6BEG9_9GAMM|nr:carboxypeptidase-like regulatory domain-containing protein [Tahibacter amnicola]UXI68190.1 carboxypeptidase-like regulatory domain-containing protein [Tahibacter amnicola]